MKLLIFDAQNLAYISFHSMKGLSTEDKDTGVIFGFLRQVISLCKKYNTNKVVFCWESRKNKRKLIYPEYKANRNKEMTEEQSFEKISFFEQVTELKNTILPSIGFRNEVYTGLESDDIIASIVLNTVWLDHEPVIVSTDEDYYQLLDHTDIYNIRKKSEYTYNDFDKEYGINPKEWTEVKAIAGCTSDNVKGCVQIGEMSVCKYFSNTLQPNKRKLIEDFVQTDQYLLNKRLVSLPLDGIDCCRYDEGKEDILKRSAFEAVCYKYDFKYFLREINSIKQILNLQ